MTEISLWECLHDAVLKHTHVDEVQRRALYEFDNWYIRRFHQQPEDTTYTLQFDGVSEARLWMEDDKQASSNCTAALQAAWCSERVSWEEFERRFSADGGDADVYEAYLLTHADGSIEFRSFMHVNDEFYPELQVRAARLTVLRNDGVSMTIQEFLKLGEAYWDAFVKQRQERDDGSVAPK